MRIEGERGAEDTATAAAELGCEMGMVMGDVGLIRWLEMLLDRWESLLLRGEGAAPARSAMTPAWNLVREIQSRAI
jgi:hypothetical protein